MADFPTRRAFVRGLASCGGLAGVAMRPSTAAVAESGVPGYEAASWTGLLAPAATPRPVVEKLWDAANAAMQIPAVKDLLLRDGFGVIIRESG
jgi:hypothetical protein